MVGAAGPFGPFGHSLQQAVSHRSVPRPDHGPYLSSRCYDVAPALARLGPISSGISGAKHPAGSTSRYCGDPRQTVVLRVNLSRCLQPPMAMDDLGLALPSRDVRSFPGTFGFLRRSLPQPANSRTQDYSNAVVLQPPREAFPRNPPSLKKCIIVNRLTMIAGQVAAAGPTTSKNSKRRHDRRFSDPVLVL